ncbi:hypothetical protein ZIOFF_044958 [Zingiber officinale]|uniref:Uncharacterized protein n=1 Tax=Zingiber officinale TaxID=94328 RepID=A0A8J5GCJ8_ZINOF|nr:hypothetical protein ZIOFF_044958 [Zingiber officinale]
MRSCPLDPRVAPDFFRWIERHSCFLHTFDSCSSLLQIVARFGLHRPAEEIVVSVIRVWSQMLLLYNVLIDGYCKIRKMKMHKAMTLLTKMLKDAVLTIYCIEHSGHCEEGSFDEVKSVFTSFLLKGYRSHSKVLEPNDPSSYLIGESNHHWAGIRGSQLAELSCAFAATEELTVWYYWATHNILQSREQMTISKS